MPPERPVRRSQFISPWGVGAMIDFPKNESLMTCGLDAWPYALEKCPSDLLVTEERLQKRLGVTHFRLPPEYRDLGPGITNAGLRIPFVRFPQWHYCPRCGSMEKLSIYGGRQRCSGPNYADGMSCYSSPHKKRPWLIPVRFVAICGYGHVEDFPFMEWVHRGKGFDETHKLRLRAGRSASTLSGIVISCSCGCEPRSMAGAFNRDSLNNIRVCGGRRPWLGEIEDGHIPCGRTLQVVQRGASNVYFPEVRSSIYLPQWESNLERKMVEVLEKHWSFLTGGLVNGKLDSARFEAIGDLYNIDYDKLMDAAAKRLKQSSSDVSLQADSEELYRKAEYDAIISGLGGDNQDFFVTNRAIDEYDAVLGRYFSNVSLIHKLRETRTLVGFSRWLPQDGRSSQEKKAQLALSGNIDWLPAIVVRGEGILFRFRDDRLAEWAKRENVVNRINILVKNYSKVRLNRGQSERPLNPRFVLLHTFAHILINQLSFECGYGSSAIRERLYCNTECPDMTMNGILIYTASGDSEGSLGGLVRQGAPGNLERIVISSLHSARWCSSDPVCMESHGQGPDSCNLAACHSCALLPETCCEEANRLLDRALIVGTFDKPEIGYFTDFNASVSRE
jgi:hypothetical protein